MICVMFSIQSDIVNQLGSACPPGQFSSQLGGCTPCTGAADFVSGSTCIVSCSNYIISSTLKICALSCGAGLNTFFDVALMLAACVTCPGDVLSGFCVSSCAAYSTANCATSSALANCGFPVSENGTCQAVCSAAKTLVSGVCLSCTNGLFLDTVSAKCVQACPVYGLLPKYVCTASLTSAALLAECGTPYVSQLTKPPFTSSWRCEKTLDCGTALLKMLDNTSYVCTDAIYQCLKAEVIGLGQYRCNDTFTCDTAFYRYYADNAVACANSTRCWNQSRILSPNSFQCTDYIDCPKAAQDFGNGSYVCQDVQSCASGSEAVNTTTSVFKCVQKVVSPGVYAGIVIAILIVVGGVVVFLLRKKIWKPKPPVEKGKMDETATSLKKTKRKPNRSLKKSLKPMVVK